MYLVAVKRDYLSAFNAIEPAILHLSQYHYYVWSIMSNSIVSKMDKVVSGTIIELFDTPARTALAVKPVVPDTTKKCKMIKLNLGFSVQSDKAKSQNFKFYRGVKLSAPEQKRALDILAKHANKAGIIIDAGQLNGQPILGNLTLGTKKVIFNILGDATHTCLWSEMPKTAIAVARVLKQWLVVQPYDDDDRDTTEWAIDAIINSARMGNGVNIFASEDGVINNLPEGVPVFDTLREAVHDWLVAVEKGESTLGAVGELHISYANAYLEDGSNVFLDAPTQPAEYTTDEYTKRIGDAMKAAKVGPGYYQLAKSRGSVDLIVD